MSLGGSVSEAQNEAVKNCRNAGYVVVVSAGNDDGDACDKSPASAAEVNDLIIQGWGFQFKCDRGERGETGGGGGGEIMTLNFPRS